MCVGVTVTLPWIHLIRLNKPGERLFSAHRQENARCLNLQAVLLLLPFVNPNTGKQQGLRLPILCCTNTPRAQRLFGFHYCHDWMDQERNLTRVSQVSLGELTAFGEANER